MMRVRIASLLAMFISLSAIGEQFSYGGFRFSKYGSVFLNGFASGVSMQDVEIPSAVEYNGSTYTVEAISSQAFWGKYISSVKIPDTVRSVGIQAFATANGSLYDTSIISGVRIVDGWVVDCGPFSSGSGGALAVGKVVLKGVRGVADNAFDQCDLLEEIIVEDTVRDIGNYAFTQCPGLTNVWICDNVTIGIGLFSRDNALESVRLPNEISIIGGNLFYQCRNLKSITIPEGVIRIEGYAFDGCQSLTSITIPDRVVNIGERAFASCTGLTAFAFKGPPPSVGTNPFGGGNNSAVGTYTAEHAAAWEAVIDSKGYWNGLKMKPSYYTVIYDANNGTGARTTATVEWGPLVMGLSLGRLTISWVGRLKILVAVRLDQTMSSPNRKKETP